MLQFVTGSSRVPLDGFKALQGEWVWPVGVVKTDVPSAAGSTGAAGPRLFTVHVVDQPIQNLPKAHTWYVSGPASLSLCHTCPTSLPSLLSFNRIDLPPYDSYELLYEKLTCAVEQTIGFHVE